MAALKADSKVVIVPCSGIGKTYGAVSREAAYVIAEDLRPEATQLVALSKLVLGDETARAQVAGSPAITIDGCKLACASKMVKESGGRVVQEIDVLDVYRRHKELKPQGVSELNEGGLKLAKALAEEVAPTIDTSTHAAGTGTSTNAAGTGASTSAFATEGIGGSHA
jgi:uncharacterized metal-binding protein